MYYVTPSFFVPTHWKHTSTQTQIHINTQMETHVDILKFFSVIDWLYLCSIALPTGHPDGVRLHRGVLGPRPGGPSDSPVCCWALLWHGVPGQAVRSLWHRGEDPWRNLCGGWKVELNRNTGPVRVAEELQPSCLKSKKFQWMHFAILVHQKCVTEEQTGNSCRWNRADTRDGLLYTNQDQHTFKSQWRISFFSSSCFKDWIKL